MIRQGEAERRLTVALLCGCTLLAMAAYAQAATPASADAARTPVAATKAQTGQEGIWKWVVPPVKMKGAYDDHDPIGLVAGKLIPADCAFNWTDPDTHKLYCFTSATSLVYFLDSPQTYIAEADKSWRALSRKVAAAR